MYYLIQVFRKPIYDGVLPSAELVVVSLDLRGRRSGHGLGLLLPPRPTTWRTGADRRARDPPREGRPALPHPEGAHPLAQGVRDPAPPAAARASTSSRRSRTSTSRSSRASASASSAATAPARARSSGSSRACCRPRRAGSFVAGRIAPILELGLGFHGELTGRENVMLQGALLGFSRAEIRERLERIVAVGRARGVHRRAGPHVLDRNGRAARLRRRDRRRS